MFGIYIVKLYCCVFVIESNMTTFLTPSPYHLLDHEYGMTPQNQIIPNPLTSPLTKSQVSYFVCNMFTKLK